MKCIIVRYSEIGLKGKNKPDFEKKLAQNIRTHLKNNKVDYERVERNSSRIIVVTEEKPDLTPVYGISSYSCAAITKPDMNEIKKEVKKIIRNFTNKTVFRVSAQRLDKRFTMTSPEIDREIGQLIVEKTAAKVNLKRFGSEIGIEILPEQAFVFDNRKKGPGGLPVGVEGKAIALIDDKNSLEAARLAMKRGCDIIPAGFDEKDISALQKHSPKPLNFNRIKNILEIDTLAERRDAKAIVTGQTLKDFKEINTKLLVLRPLIAKS